MKVRDLYVYPGRDELHNYIAYPLSNMLIAGKPGAGKSVFLNSLMVRMIQECHPDDIRITIHDMKGVEFYRWETDVPRGRFIPQMQKVNSYYQNIDVAEMNTRKHVIRPYSSFYEELDKLEELVLGRKNKLEKYKFESWRDAYTVGIDIGGRLVIIIDEYEAFMSRLDNAARLRGFVEKIIPISENVGVYFIFASQSDLGLREDMVSLFTTRVVTPCSENLAMSVIGSKSPGRSSYKYGVVWVAHEDEEIRKLFVPFYPDTWISKFIKYYSINTGE